MKVHDLVTQLYSLMNLNGRLRLGPKRKELCIHRIGKQNEHFENQSGQATRPALLQKNFNQQNKEQEKVTVGHTISLKDKPQTFVQANNTQIQVYEHETVQTGTLTERQISRQSEQFEQLTKKNQELEERTSKLQKENCQLRQEAQEKSQLTKRVKVLECQLINSDKEYYEKQLTRIKNQCESLQIECTNYKCQFNQIKQQQQEKDILVNNKSNDIKNMQKQIEKERMTIAENRAKYSEQQRALRIALEESEASNQMLCNKLQEMSRYLQREESAKKQKASIIDSLNKQVEVLASRGRDSQSKCQQLRKNFEEQISSHSKRLFLAQEVQKNTFRQSQSVISKLSTDLQTLKSQQAEKANNSQFERGQRTEEDVERQLRVVRLEQQLKQIKILLEKRDETIEQFEVKFKTYFSPEQYKGIQRRCKELEQKRLSSAKYYEQKLYKYQKQNDQLRIQNINKAQLPNSGSASFDEILKATLQQSQSLRAQIKRMRETLQISKQEAAQIRLKQKQYLNELQILRKKTQSSSKNFQIELEVEKQKMINEIDSLRRRLSTAETRLEYKIGQCRKKDDFIKSVVVGRTTPLDKETVLSQLERVFTQRENKC